MNTITTIDEVISELDTIIEWSLIHKSRIGYFATLYRRMTVAVKEGIENNRFQNGKRMEQLDIIFAKRYFDAWDAYINKQPCTDAWCSAFDACQRTDLIVLQQLIIGINTHINLDLCIAAAECCPGDKIYTLQFDFEMINKVIEEQAQLVQNTLSNIWFPLKLITSISNNQEKAVLNFSITSARQCSWANAILLANAPASLQKDHVSQIDNMAVALGKRISNPGNLVTYLLSAVRRMENPDVNSLIGLLKK